MKIFFVIMTFTILGFSGPAFKGDLEFKQEDGTKFIGRLKGDEHFSWIEDKNKNIIIYNKKSKNYEYAKVVQKDGKIDLAPSNAKVSKRQNSTYRVKKEDIYKIWKQKRDESKSKLNKDNTY